MYSCLTQGSFDVDISQKPCCLTQGSTHWGSRRVTNLHSNVSNGDSGTIHNIHSNRPQFHYICTQTTNVCAEIKPFLFARLNPNSVSNTFATKSKMCRLAWLTVWVHALHRPLSCKDVCETNFLAARQDGWYHVPTKAGRRLLKTNTLIYHTSTLFSVAHAHPSTLHSFLF